ncbi:MAG: ribosomal protein S18-alanine N-acetyltransferase [Eubacteriales bacterium]|nr:ribosomal protein S18-alanine N-acetyltransferase [Eubacteriales bacterium]
MRPVIADAVSEQLPDICALEQICFSSPWTEEQLAIQLNPSMFVFLTAYDGTQLVGYGAFQYVLDEGYISNIAVAPAYRRQGMGGAVLDALLKRAEELSLSFLTLEVRASNEAAQGLYRSRGFREVGTRRAYYSRPTEDAVLMTVFLGEETEKA